MQGVEWGCTFVFSVNEEILCFHDLGAVSDQILLPVSRGPQKARNRGMRYSRYRPYKHDHTIMDPGFHGSRIPCIPDVNDAEK